jgi:hypothetical protein
MTLPQLTIDIFFAALTCWREARGETHTTKGCVLSVIRNRVKARWIHDTTYQDVCVHPHQFSGLTQPGDPNLSKFPSSTEGAWLDCLDLAQQVVNDTYPDDTNGAVFYHDISMSGPPSVWGPVTQCYTSGRIIFYREI